MKQILVPPPKNTKREKKSYTYVLQARAPQIPKGPIFVAEN